MAIFRIDTLPHNHCQPISILEIFLLGCYHGVGRHLEVLLPSIRPGATPRGASRYPPDTGLLPLRFANASTHQNNTSF